MAKQVLGELIDEIQALPHFRTFQCTRCKHIIRVHTLQIRADCENCGLRHKCRGFGGIGTELQDIIDAVIEWAGEGEAFEAVMARRRIILGDTAES